MTGSSELPGGLSTEDIAPFFVGLAAAVARGEKITTERLANLRQVIDYLAMIAQSSSSTQLYALDPGHVGYLKRTIADVDLYVPFHLVRYFPADYLLKALIRAAASITLDPANPICISGSATFLGAPVETGDLDFCEYAVCSQQDVVAGLQRLWATLSSELLIASTKVSSKASTSARPDVTPYAAPWPTLDIVEADVNRHFPRTEPSLKLDGAYGSAALKLRPISNVVLPIDSADPDEGSAALSFVYQEAVLVAAGTPPRGLVNANSLGKYLEFLKRQAGELVSENPLKALKRCLSFFLLTNLQEPAEKIIGMLASPNVTVMTLAKRERELSLTAGLAAHPLSAQRGDVPSLPPEVIVRVSEVLEPLLRNLATQMVALVGQTYQGVT